MAISTFRFRPLLSLLPVTEILTESAHVIYVVLPLMARDLPVVFG